DAATDALVTDLPWTQDDFQTLRAQVQAALGAETVTVAGLVHKVLAAAHNVRSALPERVPPAHAAAIIDIRGQFRRLLSPGFVAATGRARLADVARYLTAIAR